MRWQKDELFFGLGEKAKASSKPYTVAVARAMASAMTPVPMKATLFAPFTARCFTATAPAAPVRMSVRYLFSCSTALGAPLAASHTTNTPDPAEQALLDVLVEAHVGQLHRPRWSALDVPALDVAVAGTRGGRLGDADVHRQGHVHLPARELRERVLHRQHELLRRFDVVHDGVVVEQHGRREF